MSQHKSNPVSAIALVCKRGPERVERSFILSTASGFQIPIADCSSNVSLSTFSLTAISPLRLRQNHYNTDVLHDFDIALNWLTPTEKTKTYILTRRLRELLPQSLILFWSFECLWCQAKLLHAMLSLLYFGFMQIKFIWLKFGSKIFLLLIFMSVSSNSMTIDKLIFPNKVHKSCHIKICRDKELYALI